MTSQRVPRFGVGSPLRSLLLVCGFLISLAIITLSRTTLTSLATDSGSMTVRRPKTSPSPRPTVTPKPTPQPTLKPTSTPSPVPTKTQLTLCKYQDDNANGVRDRGERVISWTFRVTVEGKPSRIVRSHWWNIVTQGCAIVDVPPNKRVEVEEVIESGWRPTALYADGVRVATITDYSYLTDPEKVKLLWFLNTFTPVGGALVVPSPSVSPQPSASPVSGNTQPECVSLSATPSSGGARLSVSFTSKGRDVDGMIRNFDFNFGDGESEVVETHDPQTNKDTTATVFHTYTRAGTYIASLRVKDNSGQSNEWSTTPESCKVKIEVGGEVLGTTTVTQLPKAGVSRSLSLSFLVSGIMGTVLQFLARRLIDIS